jgi:uncharacterized DUF497 family protein
MNEWFEWDPQKAAANIKKHNVTFAEAMTVFMDPMAKTIEDATHSVSERRELLIGYSANDRLLLVAFSEHNEETIRIFSAREPTRKERRDYEENAKF